MSAGLGDLRLGGLAPGVGPGGLTLIEPTAFHLAQELLDPQIHKLRNLDGRHMASGWNMEDLRLINFHMHMLRQMSRCEFILF